MNVTPWINKVFLFYSILFYSIHRKRQHIANVFYKTLFYLYCNGLFSLNSPYIFRLAKRCKDNNRMTMTRRAKMSKIDIPLRTGYLKTSIDNEAHPQIGGSTPPPPPGGGQYAATQTSMHPSGVVEIPCRAITA